MTMDMGMGMPMTMKDGYDMRLGHGTWDARPGITYKYYWDRMSLGLQGLIDVPLGMNDEQYQVGYEYRANAWIALLLDSQKKLAATFRVEGLWQGNVVGADPALNPAMMSTADPNMQGGDYLNFGYGLMYQLPGHLGRLNCEYVHPVYQNLRGCTSHPYGVPRRSDTIFPSSRITGTKAIEAKLAALEREKTATVAALKKAEEATKARLCPGQAATRSPIKPGEGQEGGKGADRQEGRTSPALALSLACCWSRRPARIFVPLGVLLRPRLRKRESLLTGVQS